MARTVRVQYGDQRATLYAEGGCQIDQFVGEGVGWVAANIDPVYPELDRLMTAARCAVWPTGAPCPMCGAVEAVG